MITVLGGGIVNLVPTSDETVLRAVPGGSAFSIAIEAARLGFPTALMVRLSRDPLGQMLRRTAEDSGIDLSASPEADEPTTIALVPACRTARNGSRREGHQHRAAPGSLYVHGTASWQWSSAELGWIPRSTTVLHIGSVIHWPAPVMGRILRTAARLRQRGALVCVDLNIRPEITQALHGTPGQARILLDRPIRLADVVRANTEDLAWLYPGRAPQAVAESWLRLGPGLAVITSGASGVMAIRESGSALHRRAAIHYAADAGLPHGDATVDTFRAADAFTAGLLGSLFQLRQREVKIHQLSAEELSEMLDAAFQAVGSAVGLALIERPA
jgi:fructokinase